MTERMQEDYGKLMRFWDTVFAAGEDRFDLPGTGNPETAWRELAPARKLLEAAETLGTKRKVLDYGCGNGWAGIAAAKGGCADVTCADVSAAGVETARYHTVLTGTDGNVRCIRVSPDWLASEPDAVYDGLVCSNVLDVIPEEAAEEILRQAARVVTPDADVLVGLNYYLSPEEISRRKITVRYGNHIYIDGILRMVSRTDGEWAGLFGKYFSVQGLDHFAWPGETAERRRLFYLRKKTDGPSGGRVQNKDIRR